MALGGVALMRMKKELDMLYRDPSPGISAWMKEDAASDLEAGARAALSHAIGRLMQRPCRALVQWSRARTGRRTHAVASS